MKVKTSVKDKKFEPIDITITVESREELAELWHRFNVRITTAAGESPDYYTKYSDNGLGLWKPINDLLSKV